MTALPPVAGPYLASVALLGGAGVAKLWRPADTSGALRAAGLPSRWIVVRFGALAEIAVVIAAAAAPGPWPAVAVAAAYGAFAGFVAMALARSWPISSCGCFGRPDTQPSFSHLVLNLGAMVGAAWWAAAAPRWWWPALFGQSGRGVPLLGATAALALLAYLIFNNPLPQARLGRAS